MRQGWIYLHFLLMCFLKCILFRSRMSPWSQLYSLKHLNLEVCNDDVLPEKLNFCMKFFLVLLTKTSKMMPKIWTFWSTNFLVERGDQCFWWKLWEMAPVQEVKWSELLMTLREFAHVRCSCLWCVGWCGHFNCRKSTSLQTKDSCRICTWTIVFSCTECQLTGTKKCTLGKQASTRCSGALIPMDGGTVT